MAINVGGLIFVIVFYVAILLAGILSAWKRKRNARKKAEADADISRSIVSSHNTSPESDEETESMLAGRSIGWVIGSFTMTATWVSGGSINGTAEAVYDSHKGLVWAQAPYGYAISLVLGGLIFAKTMRTRGYVTMLDPFQEKYGRVIGGILFLPALLGELFWTAAILAALGSTITVILDIPKLYSVIISAVVAVIYTLFGGLYSVAFTDVIQLICIFFGLWLCVPFILTDSDVHNISSTFDLWKGTLEPRFTAVWIDEMLLLSFGGIPWQVYFQRVLSAKSVKAAIWLSVIAAFGCIIMAIPPVLIGAAGRSVEDWRDVGYKYKQPEDEGQSILILPLCLNYLTPMVVGWIGLGAVSAAVMSSADSSVLSASSMFARNIYKQIFRPKASNKEITIAMKLSILGVATLATLLALTLKSVFDIWVLSSDLVYVILFPNLVCVLFVKFTNSYGSICSFFVGLFFRAAGGEQAFGLPALIKYPGYNDEDGQLFPFKTFSMIMCFLTLLLMSKVSEWMFESIPLRYDCCKVFSRPDADRTASVQSERRPSQLSEVKEKVKET